MRSASVALVLYCIVLIKSLNSCVQTKDENTMALESARHHHRIVQHASGQQTGHPEHTAVALRLRISPILDRPTHDLTIARKLYLLTGGGQL